MLVTVREVVNRTGVSDLRSRLGTVLQRRLTAEWSTTIGATEGRVMTKEPVEPLNFETRKQSRQRSICPLHH
jgi:hypothetical protein